MRFGYTLVKDAHGRIEYKQRPGKKKHFHLAVFIDEPDDILSAIRLVEYQLHETFKEPLRHNDNRDVRFVETFFTWGKFNIEATVLFLNGARETYNFYLDYDLPSDYGLNYIQLPVE
ncbi:MAG: pYEATS domain-containing protein [candidate division Zixibacteria bacterium]|nr:pYEATS domain-containing protein [candidate division Zixibacteria bacterium]